MSLSVKNLRLTQQTTANFYKKALIWSIWQMKLFPMSTLATFRKNQFYLNKGAELIYSDGITAGWSGDESFFPYDYFHSLTQIYQEES